MLSNHQADTSLSCSLFQMTLMCIVSAIQSVSQTGFNYIETDNGTKLVLCTERFVH